MSQLSFHHYLSFIGFSTVIEHDIAGSGGGWVQLPLQLPNGTSFGQFKDNSANSIANGRFVKCCSHWTDCEIYVQLLFYTLFPNRGGNSHHRLGRTSAGYALLRTTLFRITHILMQLTLLLTIGNAVFINMKS